jgi:voltage-dependent potassium channel beta subunit
MTTDMPYRRLGRSGLQVSALSFGSWVTFKTQLDEDLAGQCMEAAWDAGVNFFDNAEAYAGGESERIMGEVFRQAAWPRHSYVVSSKYFWGLHGSVNMRNTLNRKYLLQAVEASLERFGLDFLDLVFCHRADPDTPIEETVWAMHDIIERGYALYWGTSEWSADEIRAAFEIAERHHLRKPVMEQPQYHLLHRRRVEREYARLYTDWGLGLTTWSPLASGLLTGKYLDGVPGDSRATLPGYGWLRSSLTDEARNGAVRRLQAISDELGCSLAQLAVAWCAANPDVSTVITGASRPEQVVHNMGALEVMPLLTTEVLARIDDAVGGVGGVGD